MAPNSFQSIGSNLGSEEELVESLGSRGSFYGRTRECEFLRKAFQELGNRQSRILLHGFAGVGKSHLLHHFRHEVESRCYFVYAKCMEGIGADPQILIRNMWQQLGDQILSQGNKETERIRKDTKGFAKALVDVAPFLTDSLRDVLGVTSEEDADSESAATSLLKLRHLFLRFLKVLSTKDRPLVVAFDDVQRVDDSSLELLRFALMDTQIKAFMFLGVFRDDDVDISHPFTKTVRNLVDKKNIRFVDLQLTNLERDATAEVVCSLLGAPIDSESIKDLGTAIYDKTQGHLLHIKLMLETLITRSILVHSPNDNEWSWDARRLEEEIALSPNVISLIKRKMTATSKLHRDILAAAAFLPANFSVDLLKIIMEALEVELSDDELRMKLIDLQNEHFLNCVLSPDVFEFRHDSLREAASNLIIGEDESYMSMKIGKALMEAALSGEQDHSMVFSAVERLNTVPREALEIDTSLLIDFNYQAGKNAVEAAAFNLAAIYFESAIRLIESDPSQWCRNHELCFNNYQKAAEANFIIGKYVRGETFCNAAMSHAVSKTETLDLLGTLSDGLALHQHHKEALEVDTKTLEHLGLKLRRGDNKLIMRWNLSKMKQRLEASTNNDILKLEIVHDASIKRTLRTLYRMMMDAFHCNRFTLKMQCMLKLLRLSFKYGLSTEMAAGIAHFATVSYTLFGEEELGVRLTRLSIDIHRVLDSNKHLAVCLFKTIGYVEPWRQPWRELMTAFTRVYEIGMVTSEIYIGQLGILSHNITAFAVGINLDAIGEGFLFANSTTLQFRVPSVRTLYLHIHGAVLSMTGQGEQALVWAAAIADPSDIDSKDMSECNVYGWGYMMRSMVSYYFKDYALANKLYQNFLAFSTADKFFVRYVYGVFFDALIAHGLYRSQRRRRHTTRAKQALQKMKKLAERDPINLKHKFLIVEADHLATFSKVPPQDKFDEAIQLSLRKGYIQDAALANELAGEYFFRLDKRTRTEHYITRAVYLYRKWGAKAKVANLVNYWSDFVEDDKASFRSLHSWADHEFVPSSLEMDLPEDVSTLVMGSFKRRVSEKVLTNSKQISNVLQDQNVGSFRDNVGSYREEDSFRDHTIDEE